MWQSLVDSRNATCCIFHAKCISKAGKVASANLWARDDEVTVATRSEWCATVRALDV